MVMFFYLFCSNITVLRDNLIVHTLNYSVGVLFQMFFDHSSIGVGNLVGLMNASVIIFPFMALIDSSILIMPVICFVFFSILIDPPLFLVQMPFLVVDLLSLVILFVDDPSPGLGFIDHFQVIGGG